MNIAFFNTLGRKLQEFQPSDSVVKIYCCGPTVYHFAHIGNLRSYIFEDVLVRLLRSAGYEVLHVMNITDVGHLVSDADEGEDKMLLAAKRENKDVLEIARFYTQAFFQDTAKLNILTPNIVCKATEHIPQMIRLIKRLEERGYTYVAGGNVYFDTSKFPDYNKLRGEGYSTGVSRVDLDSNKRNPEDFVLWFTKSKFENHLLIWDSPWGPGYPGWHIECSAMAMEYLGETLDIHCGGIDHIPIHHTNEIAQAECATGKVFARYWLHNEFVLFNNDKMSKSKGSTVTLTDLIKSGYDPLDYRYLCLSVHYRTPLNFNEESIAAARSSRINLVHTLAKYILENQLKLDEMFNTAPSADSYISCAAEDLNTPKVLATLWSDLRTELTERTVIKILNTDKLLGLDLVDRIKKCINIPDEIKQLAKMREEKRALKQYAEADELRSQLKELGFEVFDQKNGRQLILNQRV